jgi:hAT family C-terminal dimerisation region
MMGNCIKQFLAFVEFLVIGESTSIVEDIGVPIFIFKKHKSATNGGEIKSELKKYFMDDLNVVDEACFDITRWWKVNSSILFILSHMTCDVLVIPISTMISESIFF